MTGSSGSSQSSYPKQQWSSGGTKPRTPIGGGGFVNPKVTSYGSSFGGAKTSSYKSPGYGTNFGTSFKGGVGKYGGKGFSKKALGLGVGAGFLGNYSQCFIEIHSVSTFQRRSRAWSCWDSGHHGSVSQVPAVQTSPGRSGLELSLLQSLLLRQQLLRRLPFRCPLRVGIL